MKTREELSADILSAKAVLDGAEAALYEFDSLPENNVFDSVESGGVKIERILLEQAREDCEGSGNCGADEYGRKFMVDGIVYQAILKCEYGRHDKQYYYVDRHSFSVTNTVTNEAVIDE